MNVKFANILFDEFPAEGKVFIVQLYFVKIEMGEHTVHLPFSGTIAWTGYNEAFTFDSELTLRYEHAKSGKGA
jgi:hypothetical protein